MQQYLTNKNWLRFLWRSGSLLICGLTIASCGRVDTTQSPDQLLAVPTPVVTSTSDISAAETASQSLVSTPVSSSTSKTGLDADATKIAEIEQRAQEQEIAASTSQAQVGRRPVVIPTNPPKSSNSGVRTGLTEDCRDVFPERLLATNCWTDIVDGKYISVFAGSLKQEPTQGVLIIYTTNLDGTSSSTPEYHQTVNKDGPITINKVIKSQVQVTTKEGANLAFDLITHQWGKGSSNS